MRQNADGGIDISKLRLDNSQIRFSERFGQSIVGVISNSLPRLLQRLVFFAKTGMRQGEIARQLPRIDWDDRVRRWFEGRDRARESIARFVGFPDKLLAETEERDRSGIVRKGRRHVALNINN